MPKPAAFYRCAIAALPALLALLPLLILGCSIRLGGGGSKDSNALRRVNLELRTQITELEQTLATRVAHIDSLENQIASQAGSSASGSGNASGGASGEASGGASGGDPSAITRLTKFTFDRYSGAIDTDKDKKDDTLRLYIKTFNQDGRFYPARATATINAVSIPTTGDPTKILEKSFDADAFSAAFRSTFAGTHFTLDAPLPANTPESITVKLTLTDLATGLTLDDQLTIKVAQ